MEMLEPGADVVAGRQVVKPPHTTHCTVCNKCITHHKISLQYEMTSPAFLCRHLTIILQAYRVYA